MAGETSTPYSEIEELQDLIEVYYEKGWTDGLPVVPPTEKRIMAFLDAAGLKAGEEITFIKERHVSVSAEKVAINPVLAGCRPGDGCLMGRA
jgi:hypothetical protein